MSILSDEFYYQPIRIDTINTRVFADLVAKEGDANGRGLLVTLTENGLMKDTTGITLILKWEHTSVGNQGLDNFEAVDLSKGLYKITYPAEMLNRGKVRAFIRIIDSGKLTGTRNIEITVDRGVGDDTAIASSDSFTALAQALIDVNNLESTYAPRLLSVEQQLVDKVGGGKLASMGDLGQDVKTAMTGGSVAVVGTDAVINQTVADAQLNSDKTDFLTQKKPNIFNKADVNNQLDTSFNSSGATVAGVGFTASDFIPVVNGKTYFYANVNFVVEYGANQVFIKRNTYNSSGIGSVTLDASTQYVRLACVTANINTTFFSLTNEYLLYGEAHPISVRSNKDGVQFEKMLTGIAFDQTEQYFNDYFFDERNIYTTVGSEDGLALRGDTGAEVVNVNYFVTDFIEINQNSHYYCDFFGYATVALYDINQTFIARLAWDITSFDTGNAKYIRATGKIVNKNLYHVSLYAVAPAYSDTFKNEIRNIVGTVDVLEEPVVAFVDDDGYTEFLTKVKPVFDGASIKCGIGVVTDWVGTSTFMTVEQLQQLKAEGYVITSHSSNHAATLYKKDNYVLLDNYDTSYETDMNKSLNFLQKNNLDTDIFVYPYGWFRGSNVEKMMIRNSGKFYKYAVDNGTVYETTLNVNPNMIKRIFIRDAKGLAYYQDLIDEAKLNPNALLVFGTHSGLTELTGSFLQQVVDYVVASGILVLSPSEAFAQKIQ